ncbi:MAG: TonB-dependent receptor [Sphingomonadales bacterium]
MKATNRSAITSSLIASRLSVSALALMAASMLTAPAALAQDQGNGQAAQGNAGLFEEIIISSTRKREAVSRAPAAINALSGDQLEVASMRSIEDLQYLVPNLSVGEQFGVSRIFIRGIGLTSIDLGADGAVAVLQDGALIARPAAQLTGFFDTERVEVLRGPQGTLYGRGATAGAINLITKKPTEELEGYGRFTYGNFDTIGVEAALSGPLAGDVLLGRVAVKYDKRDGYGENLFTGNDIDNQDQVSVRGSLRLRPNESWTIDLVGDYHREDDRNYAFHFFGPTTQTPFLAQLLGGQTIDEVFPNADFHDIYSNVDPINDREGFSLTGTIGWEDGPWSIKSISSYREFERTNVADLDSTDIEAFGRITYFEDSTTFSQDLVATYTADRFDILAGATYFNEELDGIVQVPLVNLNQFFPNVPADALFLQDGTVDIDAIGVFVQGTYEIVPNLRFTAGLRYSYEKRKGVGGFSFVDTVAGTGAPFTIPTNLQESWDAITPKFVLDYTFEGGTLVYASVSRGFKSGVINIGSLNPVINPEFVWAYEIGAKGTALNRRLRFSAAAFYYDYSDLQVGRVNAQSTVTTENAAAAENIGIEIETSFAITDNFTLDAHATWLDAEFTDFTTFEANRPGLGEQDLSGNSLANAPDFTFRVGATYSTPVQDMGTLSLRGEVTWTDDIFFTEFNNEDAFQESYAMFNASIRFETSDGRWAAEFYGANLADKEVIANNIVAAPLFSFPRVGSVMPPRTYGITLSTKF